MRNTQSIASQSSIYCLSVIDRLVSEAKTLLRAKNQLSGRMKRTRDVQKRHVLYLQCLSLSAKISEAITLAESMIAANMNSKN